MPSDIQQKIDELVQAYEQELRAFHEKWIPSEPQDKTLYHYTSLNNLERIMKKKSLTYTHIADLNDPSEMHYAANELEEFVRKQILDNPAQAELKEMWKNFLSILRCNFDPDHFEKEKHYFPNINSIKTNIYTLSFCEKEDDLPMWRWYGGKGAGVSIGLRSRYFGFGIEATEPLSYQRPVYTPVMYETESFKSFVRESMAFFENAILDFVAFCHQKEISKEDGICGLERLGNDLQIHLSCYLIFLLPAIKHDGYKEEKESRLYLFEYEVLSKDGSPLVKGGLNDERKFVTFPKEEPRKDGSFEFRVGKLQQTIDECSKKDSQLKATFMAFLGLKPADESTSVTPDKVKECLQKHGIKENSEQNDVEELLRMFLENPSMSALTQTGSSQTIEDKFNPLVFYKSRKDDDKRCLLPVSDYVRRYRSDELSFNDIAEIWIGPRLDFESTLLHITKILKEAGCDIGLINTEHGIHIKQSQMPYR